MESFNLSSKELMFLCAGMGAKEIYGVEDAYAGSEAHNISDEMVMIHNSLEKKGYIESDFDGNSGLRADLAEVIGMCAMCDKFIAADCQRAGSAAVNTAFYIMKDRAVKSCKTNEGYILQKADINTITDYVRDLISFEIADDIADFENVHMSLKELGEIKATADAGDDVKARERLDSHFDKTISHIILSALKHNTDFCSIAAADFNNKSARSIMLINSSSGLIRVEPLPDSGDVVFEKTDIESVNALISEYLF